MCYDCFWMVLCLWPEIVIHKNDGVYVGVCLSVSVCVCGYAHVCL